MCTQATCMIVKAIPRIAQTLNAGPSSWNAIGIESLPIVYLPDTVAMGTAPYAGLLSPDVGNLPQVARAIHRRSPIRAAATIRMMPPKASHNAGQLRSIGRTCGKRTPTISAAAPDRPAIRSTGAYGCGLVHARPRSITPARMVAHVSITCDAVSRPDERPNRSCATDGWFGWAIAGFG